MSNFLTPNVHSGTAPWTSDDSGAKNAKFPPEPEMPDFRAPTLPDFQSVSRFGPRYPQKSPILAFLTNLWPTYQDQQTSAFPSFSYYDGNQG